MPKATTKLVENAQKILDKLQSKYREATAAGAADKAEMESVSFLAHTGDEKAAAKLETLKDRALRRNFELESIQSALAVAQQKLADAQQAESQAQARKIAKEILNRADRLVALAQTVDDANRVRVEALRGIVDELTEMRSLAAGAGVFVPSHDQFTALGSRAEHTAGMQTPFAREIAEHLAPNHRRDHMSYVAGWRDAIAKSAAALVGEDKPKQQAEEAA
jgi:hypothetical protein